MYCSFVYSNKKIIGVCNWSRSNERSAPSREVPMTKELMTNLTEDQGFYGLDDIEISKP